MDIFEAEFTAVIRWPNGHFGESKRSFWALIMCRMITVIFSSKMIFLHQIEMTAIIWGIIWWKNGHFGRNNGHFGGFGQNWRILGQRRRSSGLNWTVQATESGRSQRLKSDGPRKCLVLKSKCGRLENKQLESLRKVKWTSVSDGSRRTKRLQVVANENHRFRKSTDGAI